MPPFSVCKVVSSQMYQFNLNRAVNLLLALLSSTFKYKLYNVFFSRKWNLRCETQNSYYLLNNQCVLTERQIIWISSWYSYDRTVVYRNRLILKYLESGLYILSSSAFQKGEGRNLVLTAVQLSGFYFFCLDKPKTAFCKGQCWIRIRENWVWIPALPRELIKLPWTCHTFLI